MGRWNLNWVEWAAAARLSRRLGWTAEGNDLRGGPSSGLQGRLGKVMRSVARLGGRRKPESSREACAGGS
ncbi:hypothetical protein CRG98_022624 [Punica granatum]|uniref:Uncharacterized protein n=1 Tax=Punica granatum TaxID=22663 RepID=A0A2I0JM10_PUNGR|nr:hypothetical protein CRG98_022624 [Punica granatum]